MNQMIAVLMQVPLCGTEEVHAAQDYSVRMKKGEMGTAAMRRTKKEGPKGIVEEVADLPVEEEAAEVVMSVIMATAVTGEEMMGEMRIEQDNTG